MLMNVMPMESIAKERIPLIEQQNQWKYTPAAREHKDYNVPGKCLKINIWLLTNLDYRSQSLKGT